MIAERELSVVRTHLLCHCASEARKTGDRSLTVSVFRMRDNIVSHTFYSRLIRQEKHNSKNERDKEKEKEKKEQMKRKRGREREKERGRERERQRERMRERE